MVEENKKKKALVKAQETRLRESKGHASVHTCYITAYTGWTEGEGDRKSGVADGPRKRRTGSFRG